MFLPRDIHKHFTTTTVVATELRHQHVIDCAQWADDLAAEDP